MRSRSSAARARGDEHHGDSTRRIRLLAVALALLSGSCWTGERMWRISPLEGSDSDERVNLWPLAYSDGEGTSVLWPLFDVDSRGFALRPLVAKEDSGYSVLYPFASFNTDAGEGWALPFYRFGDNAGLFPLANLGPTSWVGPVWWHDGRGGVFPIAWFGNLNLIGPLWWTRGDEAKGGLFPLAMFAETSYVGPLWWSRGGEGFGLFPLYGHGLLGAEHVGPLWYRGETTPGGGADAGLFPLVSFGDGGRRFRLLPLYSHDLGADHASRDLLLGLGHSARSEEREESWLLPLWYHRARPGASDTALLPFFWKRTRGEDARVWTLLGSRAVAPDSRSLNLYPLWWSSEHEDSGWSMLFPFFWWSHEGDERVLLTPLGGRGWSQDGQDAFVNVLGPLYHHSRSTRRDESRTAVLWPLYETHRQGERRTTRLAGLYSGTTTPEASEGTLALGLGHYERTPGGTSHRLWPLYSWSSDEELPGPLYGLTLLGHAEHGERSTTRVFPLFSAHRDAGTSAWTGPLGLAHHEREGEGETRAEQTWVWPLVGFSRGTPRAGFADRTGLVGWSDARDGRHFQLGASLLLSSFSRATPEVERSRYRALLLLTHDEESFVGAHVPAPGSRRAANRVQRSASGFLFDAFLSEHETYHAWDEGVLQDEEARTLRAYALRDGREGVPEREEVQRILATHGVTSDETPEELRAAIQRFSDEHSRTFERSHVRLPLLFGYEHDDRALEWYGPLGLVSYARDAESRSFRFLYYAYRSETRLESDGARTRRDIFPFITLDTGPDETRFSFLWHFLSYEREGARRGGHVLFVPWGDA